MMLRDPRPSPRASSVDREEWSLDAAAVLERRTRVAGIGWRLRAPDGSGSVRTGTLRHGRTLIYSEFAALRRGLAQAQRSGCRRLVVRFSDPHAARLLTAAPTPRWRGAHRSALEIVPQLRRFDQVRFESGAPTDPELTRAVGEALDSGLRTATDREEEQTRSLEAVVARARAVTLEEGSEGWVANGRYRVSLDPMRCDCPSWTARWAGVPIAGRRAGRLPCKHLVALALRVGGTVPSDWVAMARRAPP